MATKAVIALRFVDCVRADFTVRDRGEIGLGARVFVCSVAASPRRGPAVTWSDSLPSEARCPRSSSGEFVRGPIRLGE